MGKLRDVTLVFLIKKSGNKITEICLAMKKRGFGVNRWNGVGGKVESGETIELATKREAKEEIDVNLKKIIKVAEIDFYFPQNPAWDQTMHAYFVEEWEGEPIETEEMRPQWFLSEKIPYESMWPSDKFWLPNVLEGKLLRGNCIFGENDVVKDINLQTINNF